MEDIKKYSQVFSYHQAIRGEATNSSHAPHINSLAKKGTHAERVKVKKTMGTGVGERDR